MNVNVQLQGCFKRLRSLLGMVQYNDRYMKLIVKLVNTSSISN